MALVSATPVRAIWAIAVPAMLANVATALFGLADMWVIGRLGEADSQAGVELGAKFLFGLLGAFNFLRTSTVALTAQASGRADTDGMAGTLARALATSLAIGLLLIAAMPVVVPLGLRLLEATGGVHDEAARYIAVRYWSGPLWLVNCVLTGWLIAHRRVRAVLAVEVCANLTHIALDLLFVLALGWGVEGVAGATVLSEGLKTLALSALVFAHPGARAAMAALPRPETWQRARLLQLFAINRDLFLRTLLLTGGILIFAREGARQGAEVLAANGILFELFLLATLILDGFETAAQVLCGEARGAGDRSAFARTVRLSLLCAGAGAVGLAMFYAACGASVAAAFSKDPAVVAQTGQYVWWLAALPLIGFASYIYDGVFVGAAWTRAMLGTMVVAFAVYIAALVALAPWGNTGVWLAYSLFLGSRGLGQFLILPRLMRGAFSGAGRPA